MKTTSLSQTSAGQFERCKCIKAYILHFLCLWVLSPWICSSPCASAPEWYSEPVPCNPAALRSSLEPATETSSSPLQLVYIDADVGQFFFVSVCCPFSFLLKYQRNCPHLPPGQLRSPQGPCDWAASPRLWHSLACAPPDGRSRWTPGKVLRSAHKDAAGLWVADDKHCSISEVVGSKLEFMNMCPC